MGRGPMTCVTALPERNGGGNLTNLSANPSVRPSHQKRPVSWKGLLCPLQDVLWHCLLTLLLTKALALLEGSQRMLLSPQVPGISIRPTFSPELPKFWEQLPQFWEGRACPTPSLPGLEVSKSVPLSPVTGLGVGADMGSPGHSGGSETRSSPLH